MNRALLSSVLILSVGVVGYSPVGKAVDLAAQAEPAHGTLAPAPTERLAQEPNQDSLTMSCTGSIAVNNSNFTVSFTREAGFSRIEFRRPGSNQVFAQAFLSYDRKNAKGQAIWRGAVDNAANVTLVHLSTNPARVGDQVSVGYDGQWGRGTCR